MKIKIGLIIALAAALGATAFVPAASAAQLDNEGLQREVIGKVLKASMGFMTMRVLHREDGSSVMRGSMGSDEGNWTIRNNQICVRWQKRNPDEERCMSLVALGDGRYRSSMRGIVLTAEE